MCEAKLNLTAEATLYSLFAINNASSNLTIYYSLCWHTAIHHLQSISDISTFTLWRKFWNSRITKLYSLILSLICFSSNLPPSSFYNKLYIKSNETKRLCCATTQNWSHSKDDKRGTLWDIICGLLKDTEIGWYELFSLMKSCSMYLFYACIFI